MCTLRSSKECPLSFRHNTEQYSICSVKHRLHKLLYKHMAQHRRASSWGQDSAVHLKDMRHSFWRQQRPHWGQSRRVVWKRGVNDATEFKCRVLPELEYLQEPQVSPVPTEQHLWDPNHSQKHFMLQSHKTIEMMTHNLPLSTFLFCLLLFRHFGSMTCRWGPAGLSWLLGKSWSKL